MRLQVEAVILAELTSKVLGAVNRKDAIRSGILFKFDEGGISATATNGEIQICATETCPMIENGAFVVDGTKFNAVLQNLPDGGTVSIDTDIEAGRMKMVCGKAKFTFNVMPANDFPNVEITSTKWSVCEQIETSDLTAMTKAVSYAMAQDDPRQYLNGTLWHFTGERLALVATNGHRLAAKSIFSSTKDVCKFIVGRKPMLEMMKLLPALSGKVKISFSENQMLIEGKGLSMVSPLISGCFPEYTKVIPKPERSFTVNATEFLPCLKRALILSSEEIRGVKFTLDKGLEMVASNESKEENREIVDVEWSHSPVSVGFNGVYVLEALTNIGDEATQIALNDDKTAMLVKSKKGIAVVMPMRI
jgi:DNA polymerase-3 subunit beta